VLDITPKDIRDRFQKSILNMAAISLASGYITKPAVPHLLINSFKNLASVSFSTDYSFKQADKLKEAAKNAPAQTAAPAKGGKQEEVKKEEEKPKEEEVDMDLGGGLFGEEY